MERQRHVKVFEHRVEHAAATHLLLTQLGLALVLLGDFHAEGSQILRVSGQHVVGGGIGHGHGDRPTSAIHTLDQRVDLRTRDVLDGQHRGRIPMACCQTKLARLAGTGDADQGCDGENLVDARRGSLNAAGFANGLHHVHGKNALGVAKHGHRLGFGRIVPELFGIDKRTQLGQGDARHAGGRIGRRSKFGGVRCKAEQIDRSAGGGQQVGAYRVQQVLCLPHVGMQLLVEHGIGRLVGERHRPWGGLACKGKRVRLAGKAVEEEGVAHGVSLLVFQNSSVVIWSVAVHAKALSSYAGVALRSVTAAGCRGASPCGAHASCWRAASASSRWIRVSVPGRSWRRWHRARARDLH